MSEDNEQEQLDQEDDQEQTKTKPKAKAKKVSKPKDPMKKVNEDAADALAAKQKADADYEEARQARFKVLNDEMKAVDKQALMLDEVRRYQQSAIKQRAKEAELKAALATKLLK